MAKILFNTVSEPMTVSRDYESDEIEELTDDIDALSDDEIDGAYVYDTEARTLVAAESLIG